MNRIRPIRSAAALATGVAAALILAAAFYTYLRERQIALTMAPAE